MVYVHTYVYVCIPKEHISVLLCCPLFSMFTLNNETVNIWTHVIGFVYFALLLIDDNILLIPQGGGNYGDHLAFTVMDVCYLVSWQCHCSLGGEGDIRLGVTGWVIHALN